MLPLIAQRDRQHHEVVPSLLRRELQELEPALQLLAQELQELRQLHARPVVSELVLQRLVRELQSALLQLVRIAQEQKFVQKYLAELLALVLEELRHRALILAQMMLQRLVLPADYSGSTSPTLQGLKLGRFDNARTFLQRANRLHQNLVLKTLSAPLRSRTASLQAKSNG
jgi:hypothetical protein